MTNLTEQWKKGELDEGFYYLKDNQYIFIDYFNGVSFEETCDFEIKEVLAPVPSYEEWQQMKAFCEEFNALEVAEENQKLKELLDKASYYLIRYKNNDTLPERAFYEEEVSEFLDKIDEALK